MAAPFIIRYRSIKKHFNNVDLETNIPRIVCHIVWSSITWILYIYIYIHIEFVFVIVVIIVVLFICPYIYTLYYIPKQNTRQFCSIINHYLHMLTLCSYQILNPRGIKGIDDPKKCTKILVESTELNDDQYRLGNTKACISKYIFFFAISYIYIQRTPHIQKHIPYPI